MTPTAPTPIIHVSKAKSLVFAVLALAFTAAVAWKALHDVQSPDVFLAVKARGDRFNGVDFEAARWLCWEFLAAFIPIMTLGALAQAARPFLGPILAIDESGAGSYLDGLRRIPFRLDKAAFIKVTPNGFWFEPPAAKTGPRGGTLGLARAYSLFNEGPTTDAAKRLAALGFNAYLANK